MRYILHLVTRLWTNWITLVGGALTTFAASGTLLVLFSSSADQLNPYLNAITLVILPVLFIAGLGLIPIGIWWERKKGGKPGDVEQALSAAMQNQRAMYAVSFLFGLSIVNAVILGGIGQKAASHMSSAQFCGTSCHTPMQPQWTAYLDSPHSGVACVDCHVGSGVKANIAAKLNGFNQLVGVMTGDYARPVPSPVEHMRDAADTCLKCHSATANHGGHDKLYPHYQDDEQSAASFTALRLFVGGRNSATGAFEGAHAHANPNKRIEFEVTGKERSRVGKITVYEAGTRVAQYASPAETAPVESVRTMDCLDCHNRPAHQFALSAAQAVDQAIYAGMLSRDVPYMRKTAVELLDKARVPHTDAEAYFKTALTAAKVEGDTLDQTAKSLAAIYTRNVFPDMKVGFATYYTQLDHRDEKATRGCFRCHDGDYKPAFMAEGRKPKLNAKCDSCHASLATDQNPDDFDDTLATMFSDGK